MPLSRRGASHLTAEEIAQLRTALVGQVRSGSEHAAVQDAIARELAGDMDPDSTVERELAQASAARARDAVQDAAHALRRLAAGSYGTCETCHAPIPFVRLEVIPETRLCVTCQGGRLRAPLGSTGIKSGHLPG